MTFIDTISNFSFLGFDNWWYAVIFIAAFLEATPLFGLLVPGMLIVIAGGFMVKLGVLNMLDAITLAALGAILGDMIGYFLGKKYGVSFLEKYGKYFFFRKKQFEQTKKIMERHTGKSLILGRLNSLTRAFAPFVAGSTGMLFNRFLFFNVIGGIIWAVLLIVIGYLFGQSYESVARYIGRFVTIAFIAGIMIIYAYRFIDNRKHIFSKRHLHLLVLNLFSLFLFAKMVEDFFDKELVAKFDIWLNLKIPAVWSFAMNETMIFITNIASPVNLFLLSIVVLVILVGKKKWYQITLFTVGMLSGVLLEFFIKSLIQRGRPLNALVDVSGYSFPSGHATMAVIFFSLVIYIFKDSIKNKLIKWLFVLFMIFAFLSIGASRVYLNVHWFSDVIAGFALGVFWLTFLMLVFRLIYPEAHGLFYNFKKLLQKKACYFKNRS